MLLAISAVLGCDSVSSFSRIGKRKHSRHLKKPWWVDRYALLWWVPITLFLWNALLWLTLFSSCDICTKRTKQLQISINCNRKYLQKRMCLEIDSHQLCHAEWTKVSIYASIEPTATNWKWAANGRLMTLLRVYTKFVNVRCYRWIDEL